MTWVKLDTRIRSHPKLLAISPLSRLLYVWSICYAAEYRTDGFIPLSSLSSLIPDRPRLGGAPAALIAVGLWERSDGGYRIHDYHDFQRVSTETFSSPRARAQTPAGAHADAPAHATRRAPARAQTRDPEEVEVEVETPPTPPHGARARQLRSYESDLAAFSARWFPGVDARHVGLVASQLRARNHTPTVDTLRPLLEPYRTHDA